MLNEILKRKERNKEKIESLFNQSAMELSKPVMQEFDTIMTYYKCAIMEAETKLKVLNEEFSVQYDRNPISTIKTRLKKLDSIKEKLDRDGFPFTVESMEKNLSDIAGIRVICAFPDDVYLVADALLKQDDVILLSKKDYIANPKPNGYRSLHLIVTIPVFFANEKKLMKVEIQLRTISMDSWASLEHQLRYKKKIKFTEEMADELLYCASLSAEVDERMAALKNLLQVDLNQNSED